MDGYTIVLCYTRGEIIDCEFGVSYNRPPEKGVSINSMITFYELEIKIMRKQKYIYEKQSKCSVKYIPYYYKGFSRPPPLPPPENRLPR